MDTLETARKYLADRMVPDQIAAYNNLNIIEDASQVDATFHPRAALTIPYHDEAGNQIDFTRVRYFDPPLSGGVRKKPIRYQQPKNTAPEVFLPKIPGHDWAATFADPNQPIAITEGEIKSTSAMLHTGIPFIGLGGVFMWADSKVMLPTLKRINWARRQVFIVFDSDIDTNASVKLAESRLASYLVEFYAKVNRVRLPSGDNGEKYGADDYIAAFGADALRMRIREAQALSDLDHKVLQMNLKCVYLSGEDKIFVEGEEQPISKSAFISGHSLSTIQATVTSGDDNIRQVQVARAWLTHELSRRYTNTIFRPGAEDVIEEGGKTFINSWKEQPCEDGDVSHFINLTKYLFEETMAETPEGWEWPIKLLAYKAQHQTTKIPLSIMLIGDQGSGKSLWSKMITSAFGEYGKTKNIADLDQAFNAWIEDCLVAVVDDVDAAVMKRRRALLRNWISEPKIERHQKYLKDREVDNYCLMLFTSNYRNAGAFAHDDRRMLVVGAPPKVQDTDAFYQPMWDWMRNNGGAKIYNYLLNYDLDGWRPPATAPLTAEKAMASEESLSEFGLLARDMREGAFNVVDHWLAQAEQWCSHVISSPGHPDTARANEVYYALTQFPVRPWYTADELTKIFPHLLEHLPKYTGQSAASQLSVALRNESIDFLRNLDDMRGFMWKGRRQQFLIVNRDHGIPNKMKQQDFDSYMSTFGTYQLKTKLTA